MLSMDYLGERLLGTNFSSILAINFYSDIVAFFGIPHKWTRDLQTSLSILYSKHIRVGHSGH